MTICDFQQHCQDEVHINEMHAELMTLRHQMAQLLNVEPDENLTCLLKSHSKQGGGQPNVAEDANHPQHAEGKAIVDEI